MRTSRRSSLVAASLITICAAGFGDTNKVLIIGIDGCRPDALLSAETPRIDEFWKKGAFSFHAKTDSIVYSGPCWTSILTGAWSGKHGIKNNKYNTQARVPHFFQRVKDANPNLKTASIVNWEMIHEMLPDEVADIKQTAETDELVTELAKDALMNDNPDVLFVSFDNPDHDGHEYGFGPHVPEYIKTIESTDQLVGRIVDAVKSRASYAQENWLTILVTDHGGLLNRHGGKGIRPLPESLVFFIVHGSNVEHSELSRGVAAVDVSVTAMAHLGIAIDPAWNLDGQIQGIRITQQEH